MENTPMIPSAPVRSTFLTVVCVLTFIGSGWGTITAIRSYVQADKIAITTSEAVSRAEDKMDDQDKPGSGFLRSIFSSLSSYSNPSVIRESSLLTLISRLLTLAGAIMMWNLKKPGFYLYIAGIVISIAAPLIVIGKTIGLISAGAEAVFGIAFIAMYAANLNQMNPQQPPTTV